MVSILYQVWLVYLIPTSFFLIMDYWNLQQVSHYLFYDVSYGIIPAALYLLYCIHSINKIQSKPGVEQE